MVPRIGSRITPRQREGTGSGQCIPLTPSGTYEVGTHVRFPSGQAALGFGAAAVGWFDNTTCAGTPLATVNAPPVASTTTNIWVESFMSGLTAPAGTVAVAAGVGVLKIGAGGSLAGLFDRVRFGPLYEFIWASGIGPRVAEPGLMLIDPYPWSAPLEDVRLKAK